MMTGFHILTFSSILYLKSLRTLIFQAVEWNAINGSSRFPEGHLHGVEDDLIVLSGTLLWVRISLLRCACGENTQKLR